MHLSNKSMLVTAFLLFANPLAAQDKRFQAYTKAEGPGFAVLVMRDGKTLEANGYGLASLREDEKIDAQTAFNISSLTKQFTAAAILILERQGKVDLESRLSEWVPGLPSWSRQIKIRHLIHHMSGLPDYMSICTTSGSSTNADVVKVLGGFPSLDFEPGSKHEYSNSGYALLAMVVEKASGMSWAKFIRSEILDKLGMNQTWLSGEAARGKRATGYGAWPNFDVKNRSSCDDIVGDSGVHTSVSDYALWISALRQPGLIFSKTELDRIFASSKLQNGEYAPYGWGWALDFFDEEPTIFHDGAWLGFKSLAVYFEREQLWIVVFSNYEKLPTWEIIRDTLVKHRKAN
jgi:CubicO group peptidase (beta-lactamase class C family)